MKKNPGSKRSHDIGRSDIKTEVGKKMRNSKQDMEFGEAMEADMIRADNDMGKTEGLFDWESFNQSSKDTEAGPDLEFIDRMYSPDTDPNRKNGLHGGHRAKSKKKK